MLPLVLSAVSKIQQKATLLSDMQTCKPCATGLQGVCAIFLRLSVMLYRSRIQR